jgi:hypoxanthine phosphoribosyltransferase
MHTFRQVGFGILLGALYVAIYSILHLSLSSFLIVGGIGLLLAILTVYKLDQKINGPIPPWVDAAMIPSIHSKQNSPFYTKVGSIYTNAVIQNRTFVSWSQLEKYLDTIVENFEKTGQNYDAVVGIKTGGAIISDYVSKKLGIPNYKVNLSRSEYNCQKNHHDTINDIVQKRLLKNYGDYTICEGIDDNIAGKNIILIDELVTTGKTMNETYNYLKYDKKVNDIYATTISLYKGKYKGDIGIDYVIPNTVLIWPWGYDN